MSDATMPAPLGLSSAEAARRLASDGENRLEERKRKRILFDLLGRFRNPLVLVLLGAAAGSAATGDPTSAAIIAAIILFSVLLDFVQERRAQDAVNQLQRHVALMTTVIRDGKQMEIPATEVVRGDAILLRAGDLIPADARLIEVKDLFVNEALLTGESFPAEKAASAGPTAEGEDGIAQNIVCMGSSVVSGTATALVERTGKSTQLGSITHLLAKEPPPTAFALGLQDFGRLIVRLTILLVLFVLIVNLMFHRPLFESVLFALALAVGLTPELLPMIVSVTLARGALRMAKRKVIVKRLSAIHDLGSMDVLCSDKTGTLTEAKIALVRQVDITGAASDHVLNLAYLNAAFETGLKSPLDDAIMAHDGVDLAGWSKIDEVPFDFERRRVSVLVARDGLRMLVVKGAAEDVLKQSAYYQPGDGSAPRLLDAAACASAERVAEDLGRQGFRLLGVAYRDVEATLDHAHAADEAGLIFAGFAAFLDPPKVNAKPALAALKALNVSIKIVTGDNELVTRHVAQALGIEITGVVNGAEMQQMSEEALFARVETSNLFCRVTPAQKSCVLSALRQNGHVTGFLGDGINDAPSLQAADVGISVDTAVDVAKAAAAMILLEKDLGVLADGIHEGRRTFANIMKYIMMGTSSNFGNMISMAGGVLFLPFLPMLAIQILLNNLLYDLSEIPIPLDGVDDDMIAHPRRWDIHFVRNFMLVMGPISSFFDFLTFALLLWVFHAGEGLFQTGWFVESMATQVLVIFIIRTRGNPFTSRPHPALAITSISIAALAAILPYTPPGRWFGFVPLPWHFLLALTGMTVTYLMLVQLAKQAFYASYARQRD